MSTPAPAAAPAASAAAAPAQSAPQQSGSKQSKFQRGTNRETSSTENEKGKDVRQSNIIAAKGVADSVRTSLGPKGMDKMIIGQRDEVTITNDGATILTKMEVQHPTAKMLVELSKAQDIEAGDGTTSVVVIAGSLLSACQKLLGKGIHPTIISDSFKLAIQKAEQILLNNMAIPVDLQDREALIRSAKTSLSSKVVSTSSDILAPMAVDAVLKVIDSLQADNVDLNDIKVVKKLGGLMEDAELVDGLVFTQGAAKNAGGPTRVEKAKIGLVQFQISPPKTDMDNNIVAYDYQTVDRLMKEERAYLLNLCNKIKKTGCNVLLIQKSILRDAVTDQSLHFLAKMGIMVVTDIERSDVEFVSKTLGIRPVATIDSFTADKLAQADLVEEQDVGDGKIIKVTGIAKKGKTITALFRGSNKLLLDETDRSFHDALCVVRSLVKRKFMIAGGSAPEVELSLQLEKYAKELTGAEQYCVRAYAEALEVIPTTLAENAGLKPIDIVTELRNKHAEGKKYAGINVKQGCISDMVEDEVVQPLLVTLSALTLATELSRMLLKIDDIVVTRG